MYKIYFETSGEDMPASDEGSSDEGTTPPAN
jgi:hypothetical protein